jgi:type I restriction enzyme S subunit
MNYKRIGDYIKLVDNRNKDLAVTKVCGISMEKYFIPSIANTNNVDLTVYKIVKKGQFGCILMKVGRDNKVSVGYLEDDDAVVISPAYFVFEITDESKLLPQFLMMWFLRPENDRWLGFMSAGSIRGSITWDEFCDTKMPIPQIEEQRKFVALYNGLLSNQKTYENSLADLQLICDTYIENLIKTEQPKVLGEYIEQSEERNIDLKNDNLLGISVNKVFIETKSQKDKLELSNYKVVRPREFGYVSVTSRNGEKISIAILNGDAGLVSSTYIVFRVKDHSEILPEYLYLWFSRPEFDRYARFHSWGSARETFDWADMCNVKLPIPDIKTQAAIITIYHTLKTRKRINEQLKSTIKPLCPVLMKGVVENLSKLATIGN